MVYFSLTRFFLLLVSTLRFRHDVHAHDERVRAVFQRRVAVIGIREPDGEVRLALPEIIAPAPTVSPPVLRLQGVPPLVEGRAAAGISASYTYCGRNQALCSSMPATQTLPRSGRATASTMSFAVGTSRSCAIGSVTFTMRVCRPALKRRSLPAAA